MSRQTFADILKILVKKGVIQRTVLDAHPPRVNYGLTEKGKRLKTSLEAIMEELQ